MDSQTKTDEQYYEDSKHLNHRRGGLKSKITRLQIFISTKETDGDCIELQSRLDSVVLIKKDIEALKLEYYSILKDEDMDEYQAQFDDMENEIERGRP